MTQLEESLQNIHKSTSWIIWVQVIEHKSGSQPGVASLCAQEEKSVEMTAVTFEDGLLIKRWSSLQPNQACMKHPQEKDILKAYE